MATTILRVTNQAATFTPTTTRGAWDQTSALVTKQLHTTPGGAATTVASAETSSTNPFRVELARFVSEPLAAAYSFTTSDTVAWILGVLATASAVDKFHIHIFITQGDTDTLRGTILTNSIGATSWPTATAAGTTDTAPTLTAVSASAGDRIVIEIGYNATDTVTTSFTGTLNYGNSGVDLTNADTSVTTHAGNFTFTTGTGLTFANSVNVNDSVTVTESFGTNIANPSVFDSVTATDVAYLSIIHVKAFEYVHVVDGIFNSSWDDNTISSINGGTAGAGQGSQQLAQDFGAMSSKIVSVSVKLFKFNAPTDNVVVDIYDSLGGTSLGSKSIATASLSSGSYNVFAFDTPVTITPGTQYFIVVSRDGAFDSTNRWTWYQTSSSTTMGTYYGQKVYVRTNASWNAGVQSSTMAFVINYNNLSDGNQTVSPVSFINVSDTVTVTESETTLVPFMTPVVNDSITVTDVLSNIVIGDSNVLVSVFDTVTVSESVALLETSRISVSDTVTVSENVTLLDIDSVSVFDTVTVTENVKLAQVYTFSVSDTVTVSENIQRLDTDNISVSDTVAVTESVAFQETSRISVLDTVTVSENVNLTQVYTLSVSDSVGISEFVQLGLTSRVSVSDTITVAENVSRTMVSGLSVFDTVTVSESVSVAKIITVNVFDTITVRERIVDIAVSTRWVDRTAITEPTWADRAALTDTWTDRTSPASPTWGKRTPITDTWTDRTPDSSSWTKER